MGSTKIHIISFAGAQYDNLPWTNRQQITSRIAQKYPLFYIEGRVWIFRFIVHHWRQPTEIISFLKRIVWYEKKHKYLYIKAQWNLIPGSRRYTAISTFNHWLNRWLVLATAWWLGFYTPAWYRGNSSLVILVYDLEAAEYLSAFSDAKVVYDCVDDHSAQSGIDRNATRATAEEEQILKRANLVTVTSERLLILKKSRNSNTHLVLNAGDVELYREFHSNQAGEKAKELLDSIPHPILGSVGALDSYKVDFEMLYKIATKLPDWHLVFIGSPIIDQKNHAFESLIKLSNVHAVGPIAQKDVPAYVAHFDVCLIPYKNNRYNAASFPLKFWEFMATGKPIITSGLPELQKYQPLIGYANSVDKFIALVKLVLQDAKKYRAERIELSQEHSLENRADRLLKLTLDLF